MKQADGNNTSESDSPSLQKKNETGHFIAAFRKESHKDTLGNIFVTSLQQAEHTAPEILDQFYEQKKRILKATNGWLGSLIEGVFKRLQSQSSETENPCNEDEVQKVIRNFEAEVYSRSQSEEDLLHHILSQVAESTQKMIERDIQVITEYKQHSLESLNFDKDDIGQIESELEKAMRFPLNRLIHLRDTAIPRVLETKRDLPFYRFYHIKRNLKIQEKCVRLFAIKTLLTLKKKLFAALYYPQENLLRQLSFWGMRLQHKRQNYFDKLLSRIDKVTENVVSSSEISSVLGFAEEKGDILFIKRELHEIEEQLHDLESISEREKKFLLERLDGIADQIDEIVKAALPLSLKSQLEELLSKVKWTTHQIHHMKKAS